ncbi:class I histocompatibility antigen, F10 alpha chain-like, partial [Carcharodon carcharias]|uniref:class I histocompatibility antigen, F10 alpha chain-like n=1 Tax=Carcharodon carcharias TaxID=13397 RepID=UPI001B7F6EB5
MLRLILLTLLCGGVSAGSHSLRYYHTSMTPIAELPEFVTVGYVDELVLDYYDSDLRKDVPRQRWMEQNEGPEYWERQTQISQGAEQVGKANIQIAMNRTNQRNGIHTFQLMYGCEMGDGGTTAAVLQYGWDGKDFISFDKDRMVWTTPVPWGEITKDKWDRDTAWNQELKGYLERTCIEWLEKYLKYGKSQLKTGE